MEVDDKTIDTTSETVPKVDNLEYCFYNLIAQDITTIDDFEQLETISRNNVQFFINHIFSLERFSDSDGVYVKLPAKPVFPFPRVMPLPKPKPKTRWQNFAEAKGIVKRKRSRIVWDESLKDWVPRWGYKSIKKGVSSNPPIYEIKKNEDENANKFEMEKKKRKLAKLKNKYRELRNKMEASGQNLNLNDKNQGSNPATPEPLANSKGKKSRTALKKILSLSQKSDRSHGKHTPKAKGEKAVRDKALGKPKAQSLKSEQKDYNRIISKVLAQQSG